MTVTMTTDYLTCGECLREFPLQRITLFIQHKKLDCDDETEEQDRDPELQCNYCPRGFMTAWALLVHAQLTHNLKLFLEKASRSLRKPDKFSHVDQSGYSDMPLELSPLNHHFGSSLTTHDATPKDALVSSLQNKPNEDVRTSLTPGEDKTIEQYCKIADKSSTEDNAESISKHCPDQCKMGSSASIVSRNNKTRTMQAGGVTKQLLDSRSPEKKVIISNSTPECSNIQISPKQIPVCSNLQISPKQIPVCSNLQISPNQIPVCSNLQISPKQIPVCSNLQISPNQKLGVLPMSQTSLFPQCCSTSLTMSSHPVASSIEILPRTSFMSQPEPAVSILKQKLSPQALTARTSLDNHKNSAHDPATIMSNSMTATSNSPSELPRLIASSSDSSSGTIFSSICSREMSQSNDQPITSIDMSVDSTIPLFKITNVKSAKRQREESSNVAPGNYVAGIEIENPSAECCDSKGCGVTVIPGSHENLQKCCNAVVPKKRKRHMEQKHTPFSWSSSRYARRKMLHRSLSSNVARFTTSQYVGKPSAGTIYIDLEPDLLKTTSDGEEGRTFKVTQSASPGVRLTATSESPVKCSEKPVGQSKPHTLILKPGAVFSIPFTYTIPTSMATPVTSSFNVSRGSVSFVDSVAQSSTSSTCASNPDQEAVDGNHTNLNIPDIVSYSSTVGNDQAIDGGPQKMRLHQTKPFPCEKCAMAFNQRIHLKKHMSKHTGIKPYKCEECNYSTVERSHLKVHIRIHTGEKPFKCTFCEYATAQNSTLKIHLKRHHGGKMFQCQSCEKQFTQAEQLKGHKWEHGSTVVATPEQKAREDVRTPGGLGASPSQSSVPSHLSTSPSQNSSDGQARNLSPVEVKTSKSTGQQAVSGHVDNLTEESTNWQGEGSTNQQAVSSHVDNLTEESINLQGEGSTNQQAVSGHVDDLIEKSTNSHGVSSKVYNLTEKSTDQKTDNKKSTNESAYNIVRVNQETTNQSLT